MLDVVLKILANDGVRVKLLHQGIQSRRRRAADVETSKPQEIELSTVIVVLERSDDCPAIENDGAYVIVHEWHQDAQTVLSGLVDCPVNGGERLLVEQPQGRHKA